MPFLKNEKFQAFVPEFCIYGSIFIAMFAHGYVYPFHIWDSFLSSKQLKVVYMQSQSQNYFIEPYTMKMQISFLFNKVQHLTIIWEMNTFMQSHSYTLIMKLGWGIREY